MKRDVYLILREFIQNELRICEDLLLSGDYAALFKALDKLRAEARKSGLWNFTLPAEYEGHGLSYAEFAPLSEILGWSPLGHYVCNVQAPDIGNMELLLHHGTDEQQHRWLAPLASGEIRSCFAMTEPENAGSNPTLMGTKAELKNGKWIINGRKWFTTGADGAGVVIVMAVTDPDAPKHCRASMFIVSADNPGFRIIRNIPVMGDAGSGWLSHGEVEFVNCTVDESAIIGKPGDGFVLAQERLGPGRIHHGMRWIGIAERALSMTCKRALIRKISPNTVLADNDAFQSKVAESRADIEAVRALMLSTASFLDSGSMKSGRSRISLIKFLASDMLMKVLDFAIQTHGALGVTDDTILSFFYRHERGARIYDGPDEVHMMVVAREELKKYRS